METAILTSEDVESYAEMSAVIDAVESAFGAYARGDVQMPAKSYIDLPQYNGDFRSMPAYLDAGDWEAAGVKWVNVHPDNPDRHDLPTVMGTIVYSDPETAFPLAVMDGTVLTMKRTGAAAAVATDYLAVEDATTMGLVGAGVQAYTQLDAVSEVRDIERVVVSDPDEAAIDAFIDAFDGRFDVRGGDLESAAACDVLSTVTPVETPIITPEMLGDRTHVNAIGADAAGKHELADEVLLDAKLVIDDHAQTTHSGEINVPYGEGALTDADIYAELGEVVIGEKDARTAADGVTVFDSTGLAIQDVATAHVVYERATEAGEGLSTRMIN
jgi:alanine dehydrogenase